MCRKSAAEQAATPQQGALCWKDVWDGDRGGSEGCRGVKLTLIEEKKKKRGKEKCDLRCEGLGWSLPRWAHC